ncbi:hypothetical protein [Xenorhabdus thailandensis]|uniref:hypothetical protein n=1 Tax=Xenorhabdus thailandensis TaxID=3136255 RepID=UPI0030F44747
MSFQLTIKVEHRVMTTLLHIDSSARHGSSDEISHGSHTRRLTSRFVQQWIALHPETKVLYRM